MPTLFSRIFNGEIPSHIIWRTPNVLAFLDIAPIRPGHCLVIPRVEVDCFEDIDEATSQELVLVAQRIAKALKTTTGAARIGWVVAGFEVPHAHVHLIPCNHMQEMSFEQQRLPSNPEELANLAKKIREALG